VGRIRGGNIYTGGKERTAPSHSKPKGGATGRGTQGENNGLLGEKRHQNCSPLSRTRKGLLNAENLWGDTQTEKIEKKAAKLGGSTNSFKNRPALTSTNHTEVEGRPSRKKRGKTGGVRPSLGSYCTCTSSGVIRFTMWGNKKKGNWGKGWEATKVFVKCTGFGSCTLGDSGSTITIQVFEGGSEWEK